MKNNILKLYITAFYLCSTFVMFAQDPTETSDDVDFGSDGNSDATGAPIDDYVWVLAAIGMLLVFLKFRAMYKKSTTTQG